MLEGVIVDLRSSVRLAARSRGLTLIVLTSLALGIGVTAVIGTVALAVLVKPLPYERPHDLVMVWRQSVNPSPAEAFWDARRNARQILTAGTVLRWRERALPFEDFAVVESWETGWGPDADLILGDQVERLRGTLATANLFRVLGVRPARGRTFGVEETDVALISHRLWQRRFNADPNVIGATVTLSFGMPRESRRIEIVGVLPAGFHFDYPEETEIWLPLTWQEIGRHPSNALMYRAIARLRSDTPVEAAETAMQAFLDPVDRATKYPARYWLEGVHDYAVGATRGPLLLVAALAVLMLVGGALNAATALAASTVSRLRELRVRRALGASRARLARQILTECATVATLAGVLDAVIVAVMLPVTRALLPAGTPGIEAVAVNPLSVGGVCAALVVSAVLAAAIPAWLAVRADAHSQLEDSRTTTHARAGLRIRAGLLAVQFALVAGLLLTGGMLVRSFWNIVHVDKGYVVDANVYAAEFRVMNRPADDQRLIWTQSQLLDRVRELSYVDAASLTSAVPLRGVDRVNRVRRADGQVIHLNVRHVDPEYFDVMQIPLLAGRLFTDADVSAGTWVTVVSRSLAEKLYPGENPIGRFLEGTSGSRIVGVVADVRARSLLEPPLPAYYWPRGLIATTKVCVLVRANGGEQQVEADLRRIIRDLYDGQPLDWFSPLSQVVSDSVADRRAYSVIALALAVVMLVLAGAGVCGHLSHVVAERSRELAIRCALGASSRQQLRVTVDSIVPAIVGGLCVAMAVVYLAHSALAPFLFGVGRLDVASVAVAIALIAVCAAGAVIVPARRIARLDPAVMLKSD
jgi:putative ABC transport system permease protein